MKYTLNTIRSLEDRFGDSFYIFKEEEFVNNVKEFSASFKKYYKNTVLGYSYKTNYIPAICKVANELGVHAEIVSEMELLIAKKLSVQPKHIIYNGPYKTEGSIRYCLENESLLNIDNLSEIDVIEKIVSERSDFNYKIGIRINADLKDGYSSRFGFDPDSLEFAVAINKIKAIKNLKINGLHLHSTRPDKSIRSFIKRLELLNTIRETYLSEELEYIDIGGGFYGKMDDNIKTQFGDMYIPSFEEYGAEISKLMKKFFPDERVKLIIEPGVALTVNILDFVCKITDIKTILGKKIATCSGSFHNVKPSGHLKNLSLNVLSTLNNNEEPDKFDICGYTCLENDILYKDYKGILHKNDFCIFENVGAYTVVFKPPFIKLAPPIVKTSNGTTDILRYQEKFEDVFKSFNF